MLKLLSIKTHQLKKDQINQILLLKNEHWEFGKKSQYNHFKKNYLKNDINNCLYLNNNLIGYTALKYRSFSIKKKYLLFDSLIIKKKFRNKNYSKILMEFNNFIISNNNNSSFLICEKKMIKFYNIFKWSVVNKKKFSLLDHKMKKSLMSFNFNFFPLKKKIFLYLNK